MAIYRHSHHVKVLILNDVKHLMAFLETYNLWDNPVRKDLEKVLEIVSVVKNTGWSCREVGFESQYPY